MSDAAAAGDIRARAIPFADQAILFELGRADAPPSAADPAAGFNPLPIGAGTSAHTVALAARIADLAIPGVRDIVPAYRTVLVIFDPAVVVSREVERAVLGVPLDLDHQATDQPRTLTIPVAYGGDHGPDLDALAAFHDLSPDEVIARHAVGDDGYVVAFVGFAPGFGYLLGLPESLRAPRLPTPRTSVPPGSVAIGGAQTGVYSLPTPGGWRIIGRTPVRMFDPARSEPSLLRPGDRLTFRPVDVGEFDDIARRVAAGDLGVEIDGDAARQGVAPPEPAISSEPPAGTFRVVFPGLSTVVQDLGRPGFGRDGIGEGGALDRRSLILGNRLLGNDDGAAALEITLLGPELLATSEMVVAFSGADLGAVVDDVRVPPGRPVMVREAGRIRFERASASAGARAYLCVAGGIAVPPVLGSRSTDLTARIGGIEGRALRAGDEVPVGRATMAPGAIVRRRSRVPPPSSAGIETVRVCLTEQAARLGDDGVARLLGTTWTVSPRSDRMGIRLSGEPLPLPDGADVVSEGIAPGAIQVPGDGQPIVLLAGRQTVGGYIKPAAVVAADLDRLGQLRPGAGLRFEAVDIEAAGRLRVAAERRLAEESRFMGEDGARTAGEDGVQGSLPADRVWTPDGVERVIMAARAAGVERIALEDAASGFKLDLAFAPASGALRHPVATGTGIEPAPGSNDAAADRLIVVRAPVVGLVYLCPGPGEPPFVTPGDLVEPGAVVALIEVMKTFHEVTTTEAGTVAEILVTDGAPVEYGQPILEVLSAEC